MDRLPTEILHEVCKHLSSEDLRTVRHVNRVLSDVANISLFRSVHFWVETGSLQKLQAITAHHCITRYVTEFAISTPEFGLGYPCRQQRRRGPWGCDSRLPVPRFTWRGGEVHRNGTSRSTRVCACPWIGAWRRDGRDSRAGMIQWMSVWQKYLSDQTSLQLQETDIDIMTDALKKLPLVHTVSIDNRKSLKMRQLERQLGFEILVNPSVWRGHPFTVLVKSLFLAHMRPSTLKVLSDLFFDRPCDMSSGSFIDNPISKPYMCVFEALRAIDFCRIFSYRALSPSSELKAAFVLLEMVMESAPLLESMIFRIQRQTTYEDECSIQLTELSRLWQFETLKVLILEGLDGAEDRIVELLGRHRSLKEVRFSNMRLYYGTWASVLDRLRLYCYTNLQTLCLHQVYDRIRQIFTKQELRARFGWDESFEDEFWHESSNDWALDYVIGKIDFNPIEAQTDSWRRREVFPQSPRRHVTSNGFGCFAVDQRA